MARKAKKGERCVCYIANGQQKVSGVFLGKKKENAGQWNVKVSSIILTDDGEEFSTILPVYAE